MSTNAPPRYTVNPVDFQKLKGNLESAAFHAALPEWASDLMLEARNMLSIMGTKNWDIGD
jgi:hypothetical protein